MVTGRKAFAKCHPMGLGKEGKATGSPDPSVVQDLRSSIGFRQTDLPPLQRLSTAVHRGRESWEDPQSDPLDIMSGSSLCQSNVVQANLWRVCSIPPRNEEAEREGNFHAPTD